ncbi:MAG TPA: hypothetical protein VF314_03895 [Actinomycetes bacterium]
MTIRTKTLRLAGATIVCLAVVPWLVASPADAGGGKSDNSKVKICHRTNANNNPYRFIEVATEAADGKSKGDHALEHQGPVWNPTLKPAGIKWGDIIPEYTDDRGFHFPGYNWTAEGQAIWENGCKPVTPTTPPETTPPETTPPETTPPETTPPETTTPAVLPTGTTPPAGVLGEKVGPLAPSGSALSLPMALLTSLGLLLMGTALLVLSTHPVAEPARHRRH